MGVDVIGTDLRAFEQISNGKYNLGSVVLADEGDPRGGLSKVNNHKHFGSNSREISEFCNHKVRMALYNAIRTDRNGGALGPDVLSAIRTQLGIGQDGKIDANSRIGDKDLSRREIKQIITFVKEATAKKGLFETNLYNELKAAVARTTLPDTAKETLEAALLGPNGQLRKLEDASLMSLVGRLKSVLAKPGEATADELKGRAADGVQVARQAALKFIAAFTSYATVARNIAVAAPDLEAALKQEIAKLRQELGTLAANNMERATVERKLGELTTLADGFSRSINLDLNVHLLNLQMTDLLDKDDPGDLASKYVNGKMQTLLAAATTRLGSVKSTLASVKTRLAEEANKLAAENRRKLDAARDAMNQGFTALEKDLGDLDAYAEHLRTLGSEQMGARTEERLDGDKIKAAQKEVADLLAKARTDQKALLARRQEKESALVPEIAAQTAEELKQACEHLVADARTRIAALISKLNAQLAYTVVAAPGGDAEAAAQATVEKRTALTSSLEAQWDQAAQEFDALAANLKKLLESSSCSHLSSAEKDEVRDQLALIQKRLGAENRKIYVQNHPAHGAEPKDILAKATADATQLSANVIARNAANGHVALQKQLDLVGRWVRRDPDAIRTLWNDFQQLSGFSLKQLGHDEAQLRTALVPVLLRLVGHQQSKFNELATDVRSLAGKPSTMQARVLDHEMRFQEMIRGIVAKLSDPGVVARAVQMDEIFGEAGAAIVAVQSELRASNASDTVFAKQIKADGDALIDGYQHYLARLCVEPKKDGFDAAKFQAEVLESYRELEAKRLRINGYLLDLAAQNAKVSTKISTTTNPTERAALEANAERIKDLHRQLTAEAGKFGKENALTSAQLDAMQNVGFFGGRTFDLALAEKVLAGPRESMSLAERLIKATAPREVAVDLGPAPAQPAFTAGIDGNLVSSEPMPRQPLPVLDRVINDIHE